MISGRCGGAPRRFAGAAFFFPRDAIAPRGKKKDPVEQTFCSLLNGVRRLSPSVFYTPLSAVRFGRNAAKISLKMNRITAHSTIADPAGILISSCADAISPPIQAI